MIVLSKTRKTRTSPKYVSGIMILGRLVISNLDPRSTLFGLLGPQKLDTDQIRRVKNYRQKGNVANILIKLKNKPIVVLSNNDGCIIARSNEAKVLGIKMGVPVFQVRDIIDNNNVYVFSTNFALYGDMSSRVMSLLSDISPEIEIYSIDEAFMNFTGGKIVYI